MEGGRIASIGTHEELLESSEIYRETFISQNKMNAEAEAGAEETPTELELDAAATPSVDAAEELASELDVSTEEGGEAHE